MTDYLENICTFRLRRQNTREREFIDVISAEGSGKGIQASEENTENKRPEYAKQESRAAGRGGRNVRPARTAKNQPEPEYAEASYAGAAITDTEEMADRKTGVSAGKASEGNGLPINIEGEPRSTTKAGAVKETARRAEQSRQGQDDDRPALREEAIRQILEEFLA